MQKTSDREKDVEVRVERVNLTTRCYGVSWVDSCPWTDVRLNKQLTWELSSRRVHERNV